jgi:hypothetical protein
MQPESIVTRKMRDEAHHLSFFSEELLTEEMLNSYRLIRDYIRRNREVLEQQKVIAPKLSEKWLDEICTPVKEDFKLPKGKPLQSRKKDWKKRVFRLVLGAILPVLPYALIAGLLLAKQYDGFYHAMELSFKVGYVFFGLQSIIYSLVMEFLIMPLFVSRPLLVSGMSWLVLFMVLIFPFVALGSNLFNVNGIVVVLILSLLPGLLIGILLRELYQLDERHKY